MPLPAVTAALPFLLQTVGEAQGANMALGVTSKCWKTVGNLHATIGEVNTERASPLKLKDSQN